MTYDSASNSLNFDNPIAGTYTLDIVLTDQYGMQSHNSLKIDVLA